MSRLEQDAVARLVQDLERADLGDPRRVRRAQEMVARLARSPDVSLPIALVTGAELEGAYRFLSNEHVIFDDLLEPHIESTVERAQHAGTVLVLHDTTTCTFAHADPEEVGYLPTGKAGLLLHLGLVVDMHRWRRPLGIVHAETLSRPQRSRHRARSKTGSNVSGKEMKWANKEYERWFRGIAEAEDRLQGVQVIHVADSESDCYPLMSTMIRENQRFIFRARHDRVVDDDGEKAHLRDVVKRAKLRVSREVPLSRRLPTSIPRSAHKPRAARIADLHIASTLATLHRPRGSEGCPPTLTVHVVHVYEPTPPAGQDAVDWLLYTTEPIDTVKRIEEIVDAYRTRWLIEEFNKALKTGCVVQKRQLESQEAILNLLALCLPIAVELLALRSLARQHPPRPAADLLTRTQIGALRALSHRPVPRAPTAQDVLWCIAGIGGHIKNNGDPGWQVLQRGMQKFLAFAEGWAAHEAKM